MKKYAILFLALIALFAFVSCGRKVFIPQYNTAKEQYDFAKTQKDSSYIIVDTEKRETKFKDIIKAFKKVEEYYPNDKEYVPLALIAIGDCYRYIENYSKAVDSYEQAISRFGTIEEVKPFAMFGAAISYDKLKNYDKSQKYLKFIIDNYANSESPALKELVKNANSKYSKIKVK